MATVSPYQPPAEPAPPPRGPDPNGWWLVGAPALAAVLLPFIPFRGVAITLVVIVIGVVAYWAKRDGEELGHPHSAWLFGMALLPVTLPLYTHVRRDWGASLKLPFAIPAVIALGAAFWFHGDLLRKLVPPAKVTVSCRQRSDVPRDGYICKTEHVGGYEDARACWDLVADCDDGTKITERACSHAVVRETREGIVPFEYSEGIEGCTAITGAVVEHLQVVLPEGDALTPVAP
jgi:hypothetical protein